MARLMSEARVMTSSPCCQSFFSSRSISLTSTARPKDVSAAMQLKSSPGAAVARHQFIRFFRSPGTVGIKIQLRRVLFRRPCVFDEIDERPRLLHFIVPRKQRGVAAHRVEQQTFVSFRARFAEGSAVMKIHFHRLNPKAGA